MAAPWWQAQVACNFVPLTGQDVVYKGGLARALDSTAKQSCDAALRRHHRPPHHCPWRVLDGGAGGQSTVLSSLSSLTRKPVITVTGTGSISFPSLLDTWGLLPREIRVAHRREHPRSCTRVAEYRRHSGFKTGWCVMPEVTPLPHQIASIEPPSHL